MTAERQSHLTGEAGSALPEPLAFGDQLALGDPLALGARLRDTLHQTLDVDASHDVAFAPGYPQAAVLVPLRVHADGLRVLFTVRAPWLKHHAGEISFPGGRVEAADASPVHSALRELTEETGLGADAVEIVGFLPPRVSISRYVVVPMVGLVAGDLPLYPDANEVAEIFEVPLQVFSELSRFQPESRTYEGLTRHSYAFQYQDRRIWGLTGWLLYDLCTRLFAADGAR